MMISRVYIIKGTVQGVGFRSFVYNRAKALGIKGYVENLDDGSVKVIAEGEEPDLSVFEGYLYEGSAFSRVDSVEFEELPVQGHKDFEVF
ncbi:MAG: acylphosphatase [Thermotogae bacterium]|jgi:acylphosphatase|nr:acylphosphatase [Thermotogota bacterium]MCL5031929.1 acylphosphatase [Thermotogota bacterium]